jgi:hypothetical protein
LNALDLVYDEIRPVDFILDKGAQKLSKELAAIMI